ncbi:hypothetical protein FS837_002946 [Tulasnella sp. UAMH 9824]|nr:hypothetical protein FS837_002946 [Tulasnella sp. UAMH 9824]
MERAKNLRTQGRGLYDSARAARAVGIFVKAVNIRNLYFMDGHRWVDDTLRWDRLLDAVCSMKLDKLVLQQIEGLPSYVAPVLRTQPALTDLTIMPGSARLGGLLETDIPRLASLNSTLSHASLIVPGRPVEELQLIYGNHEQRLDEHWFKQLALSTGPIKKFSMTLHAPSNDNLVRDTIRMIRRYIPSMEHLTLKVKGEISAAVFLEASLLGSLVLSSLTDQLNSIPSITSPTPVDQSHRKEIPNSVVDINLQLKTACPELVDIHWTPYNPI